MNDAAQPLIRLDKVTNTPAARSTCSTGRWWTAPCEAKAEVGWATICRGRVTGRAAEEAGETACRHAAGE